MKLNLIGRPVVPADQMDRNIELARARGLPTIKGRAGTCSGPLHVIGGGPSARRFLELRPPGEIWAINGTCRWLMDAGFDPVFFSVDALPMVADFARGAQRAVIAEQCDPSVYDALRGADITTFECNHGEVIMTGSTTATATPLTAIELGYAPITFWGCEGSYWDGQTHADRHEPRAAELVVALAGKEYLTAPDFLVQCEEMAAFFALEREHNPGPPVFREESGGLLRAMIEHGTDYDVKWLSNGMIATLIPEAA